MRLKNHHTVLSLTMYLCSTALVAAQSTQDEIIRDLTRSGYDEISVERTLLGRTRIEAASRYRSREVVINANDEIVRDRSRNYNGLSEQEIEDVLSGVERRLGRRLLSEEIEELFDELDDDGDAEEIDRFVDDLEDDEGDNDDNDDNDDGDDNTDDDDDGDEDNDDGEDDGGDDNNDDDDDNDGDDVDDDDEGGERDDDDDDDDED